MASFRSWLLRKRAEEQSDDLGKRRINPMKRARKNKPYNINDPELQSLYEYARINLEQAQKTAKEKKQ